MRLVSLTISGYRQFLDQSTLVVPPGLTGICGPNGVGKSKLIEAIGYALFGAQKVLPASDKEADLASAAGGGKVLPDVRLVVEAHGHRYRIIRGRKGKSKDCRVEELIADSSGNETVLPVAASPSEVTKKVIELFGITPDAYLRTFVARQKEVAGIQGIKTDRERQQFINRMIGLAQVEKALALADVERKEQKSKLDERIAEVGDGADVMKAQATLTECQRAVEVARLEEERLQAERETAKAATETARNEQGRRKEQTTEAQRKREELSRLAAALPDLETGLQEAEALASSAAAAAEKIRVAEGILNDTRDALERLAHHVTLERINVLQAQIAEAKEVFNKINAQHTAREQLATEVRAAEAHVDKTTESTGGADVNVAAWKRDYEAAQAAVTHLRKNVHVVTELGPSGACSHCGQHLGPNLSTALAHLNVALKEAQEQQEHIRTQWEESKERATQAHEEHITAVAARATLQARYEEGKNLPGLLAESQGRLNELRGELQAYPISLHELIYDPESHRAADEACRQQSEAEEAIRANERLANQAEGARESVGRARRQWDENVSRRATLTAELLELANIEVAFHKATDSLALCEDEERNLEQALKGAAAITTTVRAEAGIAEDRLRQARELQERLQKMRREAEIAERTATCIRETRDEITAEACPRLSEMMEGWARALMGAHFSMVRLTPEYRVEADNGSGIHPIDHFSGGEQTLLAVMLRVAISLYCQERAGMDAGFLILDEVFGDQDELHRGQLVQFLNEIKPHYHQILIVNHVADVTQMLDSIIDVEPTGERMSRARVRRH